MPCDQKRDQADTTASGSSIGLHTQVVKPAVLTGEMHTVNFTKVSDEPILKGKSRKNDLYFKLAISN